MSSDNQLPTLVIFHYEICLNMKNTDEHEKCNWFYYEYTQSPWLVINMCNFLLNKLCFTDVVAAHFM